jgi:hypothetical protein
MKLVTTSRRRKGFFKILFYLFYLLVFFTKGPKAKMMVEYVSMCVQVRKNAKTQITASGHPN